jgi:hypothetical protein
MVNIKTPKTELQGVNGYTDFQCVRVLSGPNEVIWSFSGGFNQKTPEKTVKKNKHMHNKPLKI